MKAFLWGCCGLVALGLMTLWPQQDDLWLVKFPASNNHSDMLKQLAYVDGDIVDIVNDRTIVFNPSSKTSSQKLYELGAVLVVNASARYGCVS